MKILVKKHFGRLIPLYDSDLDKLKSAKLKEGETYEIEIVKKRNSLFHRKYFALLNLCFDNQDVFTEFDELRTYLTCKAGFYKQIETPNGFMIMPDSISFAKMEQVDFEDLYSKTIQAICNFIDIQEKDIIDEIVNYM